MRTFFITGTSRGIGLELVRQILSSSSSPEQSHRHLSSPRKDDILTLCCCSRSVELLSLQEQHPDRLTVLPLDVAQPDSFQSLSSSLSSPIDVVIANAGIIGDRQTALECAPDQMMEVFNTNVIGTIRTFQTLTSSVLKSSEKLFVAISSSMGSIEKTSSSSASSATSYRVSKAAVNMLGVSFAAEPNIKASGGRVLLVHPGWVQTDMGNSGGRTADISADESATGILDVINRAKDLTKNSQEGQSNVAFVNYKGESLPW